MTTPYELWHSPGARSLRVLWTLEELGLANQVTVHVLGFPPRVHHEEYLGINPLGSIPYFRHGEVRLSKSMAICEYLASRHQGGLDIQAHEIGYAAYRQYCYFGEATLMPPLGILVRQLLLLTEEQRSPSVMYNARQLFRDRQAPLVEVLRHQDVLAGGRFSLADISVGYALSLADSLGEQKLFVPEVANYLQRLTSRPSYVRARRHLEPQ
ncbi:glutathione S-transferase family protein [Bradyrhizobium sp. STM 3557]|uniref:glutathione S-transferase family protein n=1 Tax=Bradyrhizobium sp. STM 3557 TaxID=578920 RepID=UPI00388E2F1C